MDKDKIQTYTKIPRIDLQSLLHILRDTHKLTQDARTLLRLFLRDDKLHRRGIHPISQRSDDTKICYGKESVKFVLLEGLMALMSQEREKYVRAMVQSLIAKGGTY